MAGLIIFFISVSLSIVTGVAVLIKNSRQASNVTYGLTSLSYVLLSTCNYLSTLTEGEDKLFFARFVMVFTSTSVLLTFYLVKSLLGEAGPGRHSAYHFVREKVIGIAVTLIVIILNLSPSVIAEVEGSSLVFGTGIIIFALHMLALTGGVIFSLFGAIVSRGVHGRVHAQATLLLVGFVPVFMIAPITGVYLPVVQGDLRFIILTPLYSAFFVMMVGYAMVRHKLFDLRFYVLRLMVFVLSQLMLSVMYVAPILYITSKLLGLYLDHETFILSTVIFTVAAYYYDSLHKWFRRITNRVFLQDTYDPPELFAALNQKLASVLDLNRMLTDINDLLSEVIRPEFSYFVLCDEDGTMRSVGNRPVQSIGVRETLRNVMSFQGNVVIINALDDSDLQESMARASISAIVRVNVEGSEERNTIYLVLGPKKSGSQYSLQDVRVFEALSNSLLIALQNAMRYEEIERFNETLQDKVTAATRKLQKTNEKLVQLDETKDEFISMASHQLRTPLTSIKGYLSMVLEGDAGDISPSQRKMLDQAFVSSQRMVALIADLLNVSRLRTGKFVIEPSMTNLADVVKGEVAQLKETAAGRHLELTFEAPSSFPQLYMDETKTRQVIMNFIDNAIYYTPAGGHIHVKLADSAKTIEFTVSDDGIGVPKSEQSHLFTKFYRAGNARKARPDGTGLGLFMAKKVIVAQGGAVLFKSRPGKGSTFGFTFAKNKLQPPAAPQA